MGRAPAVVLAYLCLFKKVRYWKKAAEVHKYMKDHRNVCAPNLHAVEKAIKINVKFQE